MKKNTIEIIQIQVDADNITEVIDNKTMQMRNAK